MKIHMPSAYVKVVANLMLDQDDDLVPATSLALEADVEPAVLDELREGYTDRFFEPAVDKAPRVPSMPDLAAQKLKREYEGGRLHLDLRETDGLDFEDEDIELGGVNVKDITFEPLATGRVCLKATAIMETNEEQRGKLAALLKHHVKATFTKLTQKPLMAPEKPADDAASRTGDLPLQ